MTIYRHFQIFVKEFLKIFFMLDAGKIIGLRIRKLREEQNLTQTDVATAAGVKRSTYAEWENGIEPKIIPLLKIASFLKVGIEELVYGIIDDFPAKNNEDFQALKEDVEMLKNFMLSEKESKYKKKSKSKVQK
jgi:transcriptional regulator with XRE-family HTH domain